MKNTRLFKKNIYNLVINYHPRCRCLSLSLVSCSDMSVPGSVRTLLSISNLYNDCKCTCGTVHQSAGRFSQVSTQPDAEENLHQWCTDNFHGLLQPLYWLVERDHKSRISFLFAYRFHQKGSLEKVIAHKKIYSSDRPFWAHDPGWCKFVEITAEDPHIPFRLHFSGLAKWKPVFLSSPSA